MLTVHNYRYLLVSALAYFSCHSHVLHCIVQVGQTFACLHTQCICICVYMLCAGFGKLCWGMTGCGLEPYRGSHGADNV